MIKEFFTRLRFLVIELFLATVFTTAVISAGVFLGIITPTDTTDVAVQLAIQTRLPNGHVHLPAGNYTVNNILLIRGAHGFTLDGDGEGNTVIYTTASLAGKPAILVQGSSYVTIQGITIYGVTGAPPSAGIESDSNDSSGVSTHLTVRDVAIGSPSSNSFTDCIDYKPASLPDANNDFGYFDNVTCYNFTRYAYSFVGVNPLAEQIVGGVIGNGPIAYHLEGGSIRVFGGELNVSVADFDFQNIIDPSQPIYQHPSIIYGVSSEGGSDLIHTGSSPANVVMMAVEHKFATAGSKFIDWENNGHFTMMGSTLDGNSSATLNFIGPKPSPQPLYPYPVVTMTSNPLIGPGTINTNGRLFMSGNCWNINETVNTTTPAIAKDYGSTCGTVKIVKKASVP